MAVGAGLLGARVDAFGRDAACGAREVQAVPASGRRRVDCRVLAAGACHRAEREADLNGEAIRGQAARCGAPSPQLGASMGCRPGRLAEVELLGLRWQDVELLERRPGTHSCQGRPRLASRRCSSKRRPGHAQGSTTERYLHAARTRYRDAAELAEARLLAAASEVVTDPVESRVEARAPHRAPSAFPAFAGTSELPGLDSNQQPSG